MLRKESHVSQEGGTSQAVFWFSITSREFSDQQKNPLRQNFTATMTMEIGRIIFNSSKLVSLNFSRLSQIGTMLAFRSHSPSLCLLRGPMAQHPSVGSPRSTQLGTAVEQAPPGLTGALHVLFLLPPTE